jgi:serine/threonine-protein kinase
MIPELAEDEALVARFLRERAILTRLDSPFVVQVFDMVAESGRLAIVMQFVDGADLRAELNRVRTLPPSEALRVLALVLRGVAAAHGLGIVHRDLKPGNVLLTRDPSGLLIPKVSDFGIASLAEGATRLTDSSAVIGTPVYMAPEQADNGDVGPSADIYSAGVMLYEMVSGVTPFVGRPMVVLRGHVERDPGRIPGLPEDVWRVLGWMLAKNPADRFPTALSAAEAMEDLAPRLAGLPPLPPMDAPPTSYPSPIPASTTMMGTTFTGPRPVSPDQTAVGQVNLPGGPPGSGRGAGGSGTGGSKAPLWAALAVAFVLLLVVVGLVVSSLSGDDTPAASGSGLPVSQVSEGTANPSETAVPTPTRSRGASTTPSNSSPTVDPTRAAVIRHAGPATLRPENSIDLDSRADNWDQNSTAGAASPDLYLSYGGDSIYSYSSGSDNIVPVTAGSEVSYQTCAAATGYTSSLSADFIQEHTPFCVLTDGNRYAYVTITESVPAEGGGFSSVVLNITTFELEARPTPSA